MGLFSRKKEEPPHLPEVKPMAAYPMEHQMGEVDELTQQPLPPLPPPLSNNEQITEAVVTGPELMRAGPREIHEAKPKEEAGRPIFVRIDKYNKAISDLEYIKKEIAILEGLIKDLKEIKSKEENELREWQAELEEIRTRLSSLDENLFKEV
ncbi:MAG: hypothetical protein QXO70_01680 [Candidatus Pacearchaeota archaeon]